MIEYLKALFHNLFGRSDPSEIYDDAEDELMVKPEKVLHLYRTYYPKGVHGTLIFPNGEIIYTVEKPWLDNKRGESCIPEGTYPLNYRSSPVVERTSRGEFTHGWEIAEVEGRTYIMYHVGNWPSRDSDGCVLVGSAHAFDKGEPVVWSSIPAFQKFMALMDEYLPDVIVIEEQKTE